MNFSAGPMAKKIFKERRFSIIVALVCVLLFLALQIWNACAPLPVSDWNKKEISKIKVARPDDFTFAVFGDNKGNRSVFEPLLRDIDHRMEISLAIDVGDLVSEGKKGPYRRFLNQVQKNIAIPLLTAIGNHDLNKGSGNYREIFGPTYYAFQAGEGYFIVLDAVTESGFDKAERKWLEEELQKSQTSKVRFVFMHVPPFDPRGGAFNKSLPEKDGKDLLELFRRYNVTHLFASHIHGYFSGVWEGVPYTITGGGGAALQGSDPEHFFHHYIEVHTHDGMADTTVRRIDAGNVMKSLYNLMGGFLREWGLLAVAGICLLSLGLSVGRAYCSRSHAPKG